MLFRSYRLCGLTAQSMTEYLLVDLLFHTQILYEAVRGIRMSCICFVKAVVYLDRVLKTLGGMSRQGNSGKVSDDEYILKLYNEAEYQQVQETDS